MGEVGEVVCTINILYVRITTQYTAIINHF